MPNILHVAIGPGSRFVVLDSKANMPNSCKGSYSYRKIAVLECRPGFEPKTIDDRAHGVLRIVRIWDRRCGGPGERNAAARARAAAIELANRMAGEGGGP